MSGTLQCEADTVEIERRVLRCRDCQVGSWAVLQFARCAMEGKTALAGTLVEEASLEPGVAGPFAVACLPKMCRACLDRTIWSCVTRITLAEPPALGQMRCRR